MRQAAPGDGGWMGPPRHPGRAARRAEHRGIGGPRVGGRRAAAWGHMTRLAKSSVDCKIHAAHKGGKLGGGELAATATATATEEPRRKLGAPRQTVPIIIA